MRGFQGTPAQTGKEGLYRLVEQARLSFREEVMTRKKSYRRYVLDFIHSKQFHDAKDAWSKNEHQKNYHTVVDLLSNHERLVRKYFDCEMADKSYIPKLLDEFYASDLPKISCESERSESDDPIQKGQSMNVRTVMDRHTLGLIVQLANEVNLFKEILNEDEVAIRYVSDTLQTVTSRNNSRVVLLLDKLASHDVISYDWQSVIAKKQLVVSSSGKKYLNQHDISSTLYRLNETLPGAEGKRLLSIIDKYITLIKKDKDKKGISKY